MISQKDYSTKALLITLLSFNKDNVAFVAFTLKWYTIGN